MVTNARSILQYAHICLIGSVMVRRIRVIHDTEAMMRMVPSSNRGTSSGDGLDANGDGGNEVMTTSI